MKKKILGILLFSLALSSLAYAEEDAMDILERMRARIEKEDAERARLAAEARELGIKSGDVTSVEEVEAMVEAKKAEEAKPKTEAEKLEATRKKALVKLDFYERVVRSVDREEKEISDYYGVMGEEKERPSIMDEREAEAMQEAPAEMTETTMEEVKQ